MHLIIRLMADGLLIPIVLIAIYSLWWKVPKSERFSTYSRVVMAGLTSFLFAKLIAAAWQPDAERPFELTHQAAGALYLQNAGFPSDHALLSMFLTITVFYVTRSRKLTIVMAILTALVCLGRVLALVHTPLDVIGGVIIACTGGLWYLQTERAHARKSIRSKRKNVVQ